MDDVEFKELIELVKAQSKTILELIETIQNYQEKVMYMQKNCDEFHVHVYDYNNKE